MDEYGKLLENRNLSMMSNGDLYERDTRTLSRRVTILIAASVVVCVVTSAVSVAAAVVCYQSWAAMSAAPLNAGSGTFGPHLYPAQSTPTTHTGAQRVHYINKALKIEGTSAQVLSSADSESFADVIVDSPKSDHGESDSLDTLDDDHVGSEEEEEEYVDDSVDDDYYDIENVMETAVDVEHDAADEDIDDFEVLDGDDEEKELEGSGASEAGDLETDSGAVDRSLDADSELKTRPRITRSAKKPKNEKPKKGNKSMRKLSKLIKSLGERLTALNESFHRDLSERLAVLNHTVHQASRPSTHRGHTGLMAAHFEGGKADNSGKEGSALRIFQPAPWVDDASSPVTYSNETGRANVKEDGVYLVYAMCLNQGISNDKYLSIETKRGNDNSVIKRFYCQNGMFQAGGMADSLQSCFVQGVVRLNANDVIEIHGRRAEIILGNGSYFGVIQLSRMLGSSGEKSVKQQQQKGGT